MGSPNPTLRSTMFSVSEDEMLFKCNCYVLDLTIKLPMLPVYAEGGIRRVWGRGWDEGWEGRVRWAGGGGGGGGGTGDRRSGVEGHAVYFINVVYAAPVFKRIIRECLPSAYQTVCTCPCTKS